MGLEPDCRSPEEASRVSLSEGGDEDREGTGQKGWEGSEETLVEESFLNMVLGVKFQTNLLRTGSVYGWNDVTVPLRHILMFHGPPQGWY